MNRRTPNIACPTVEISTGRGLVSQFERSHVMERGDAIWMDFDPQTGHEQSGRRPVLVLSPREYNRPTGLALLCPITNKAKKYPYEVAIPKGFDVGGVILADQVKTLDWKKRKAAYLCTLPFEVLDEVLQKLLTLIDPDEDNGKE